MKRFDRVAGSLKWLAASLVVAVSAGCGGGVRDLAGSHLAGDYSWSWTTGATADSGAPVVV